MANTQELAKDKWLCPLSGKKFKGPEFVRKHILTKHLEKLDELKKDVSFDVSYIYASLFTALCSCGCSLKVCIAINGTLCHY